MTRLTDAEWTVLDVLWRGGSQSLGPIVEQLKTSTSWSRNTVHTYLTRMEGKGLVTIDRTRDPHLYSAAVTRDSCAARERRTLLDKVYGGSAGDLVAAFLKEEALSPQERERLRRLLDEMEV